MKILTEIHRGALTNSCAESCPSAQFAASLPPSSRHKKASFASLIALLAPGISFAVGLFLVRDKPGFSWLGLNGTVPWQFWVIAACGSLATVAGIGDWAFHRWKARCAIGRKERNCELLALTGGGIPMFVLMAAASVSPNPMKYLIPVIVVLLFTTVLICYDEFIFHRRRCRTFETVLHRVLVFGNGTAWLAWAHWCFARGGPHA